jgi:antitoxin component of MazEF toxin-antitoxin module
MLIMLMRIKLNKWGNSWAIRLPANYLKELDIDPNQGIDLKLEGDRIVIKKTSSPYKGKYSLEELLEGINPPQKHGEIWDDSDPVGKEIW